MIGIYAIRNLKTDRRYIGQSINIELRFKTHKHNLLKGIHFNTHLQNAWIFYGKENFVFEIIEECSRDDLNVRETYWKLYYDPNTYNLGNTGNVGTTSDETCQKISRTIRQNLNSMTSEERKLKFGHNKNKGKHRSEQTKQSISATLQGRSSYIRTNEILLKQRANSSCKKIIFQYSKEGLFIRSWTSIAECIRKNPQFDQAAISNCCKRNRISTKGYTFRFATQKELRLLELGYIPCLNS